MVRIKRIHERPAPTDGRRVLVDRIWPCGIAKADAKLDAWYKEIAPSAGLRRWFQHDPTRWPGFQRRYREELRRSPARELLENLAQVARAETLTLVYSARDEHHNQARVLLEVLSERLESQHRGQRLDTLSGPRLSSHALQGRQGAHVPRTVATADAAPLLIPRSLAQALLRLYDVPDPRRPGRVIRGYDRSHALRTARLCAAVARRLGHPPLRLIQYQIACVLHDLGRAGLDRALFGRIWSWAKVRAIPTRPREWRAVHPQTRYGRETEAFVKRYGRELEADGIRMDRWAVEQIEMRLGYARRLRRRLREVHPTLRRLGIRWSPWMEQVMLYYYYPEKLTDAPAWVHELAEVLVACEQFEAYNNRQRGQDYYVRRREQVSEAFAYLEKLRQDELLSDPVVDAIRALATEGVFTPVIEESRQRPLSRREHQYLRALAHEVVR